MNKPGLFILLLVFLFLFSCRQPGRRDQNEQTTLYIVHAGSLTYPLKHISEAYQRENQNVRIQTEAWGSKAGARRIMELDTPCDIYLSADYMVIEQMLIPDHASWYISFAANEMAIVYSQHSRYADEISQDNWYEIMLRQDVNIGRSNPDHDPCGVRSVFTAKLAELYYRKEGLADLLLNKDTQNIRPKETDLIALLESRHLDYIFLYRSVAQQHGLPYLQLPPELHQGDAGMHHWYARVSTQTLGSRPGERLTETGQPMVYGLTIPHKSSQTEQARHFLHFLLDREKGLKIMEAMGQAGVVPSPNPYYRIIPEDLQQYALPLHQTEETEAR
jgi:molybdate/tungstate transport system substrate-binding protein